MSLLLTKTCEYAILVSIQQGRHFTVNTSVKMEAELDLKLPPSIHDLIPTKTVISSPVFQVDYTGSCTFNTTLVYFVSFKQLQRLRRTDAKTTLFIRKSNDDCSHLILSISTAKEVIPQSQHKLDHIYKFVLDKGAWFNIPKSRQQLKCGLFYVAMPDNSNNSVILNTPSIQLRSPPSTPIMTKRLNLTNSNRKKKISSILGTSSNTPSVTTTPSKTQQERVPLRRTKSSLVDLNIEELSDILKKINIFSKEDNTKPPVPKIPQSLPQVQQSYHQIGKGNSEYTFYFKVMYCDYINSNLLRQSTPITKRITHLKKPFISFTFLTQYNLIPVASINQKQQQQNTCYKLRGHLNDIQQWLTMKQSIELNYIIMDKYTKESFGKSTISLKQHIKTISDKIYPVYNNEELIAKLTIRMGIMNGWHSNDSIDSDDQQQQQSISMDTEQYKRRPTTTTVIDDSWDMILLQNNKKSRHLSQSSVPTLLTSSTTSSTKSSSNNNTTIPSIQYIQPQRPAFIKKSKYSTSSYSSQH